MSHLFLLILFLCAGCTSSYEPSSGKEGYSEICSFGKKMRRQKHWDLEMVGGIYDTPHVKRMDAGFVCESTVDIAEARRMIVQGVAAFLEDINQNSRLRQHLPQFPLTHESIFLSLAFTQNGLTVPAPYVGHAFLFNGKKYATPLKAQKGDFERIHEESFEEALRIVAAEKAVQPSDTVPLTTSSCAEATPSEQQEPVLKEITKKVAECQ